MAITPKRRIGDTGEDVACKYLIGKGYDIVDRNYLKKWGEIDIVATKPGLMVFVEVKSVSRGTLRPEENMHTHKLQRLQRVVQTYLLDKKVPQTIEWRIDLLCVYLDFETRKARVEVLENIM
jgi:putative endonuclease